jgi:hypothetical protein
MVQHSSVQPRKEVAFLLKCFHSCNIILLLLIVSTAVIIIPVPPIILFLLLFFLLNATCFACERIFLWKYIVLLDFYT